MVYVTHDQVEAMTMADRVVLLNGGRIEQNATPVELYERPANTFVARFIGTPPMNLLPLDAVPGRRGDRRHRRPGGRAAGLRRPARWASGPSTSCWASQRGVRAEVAAIEYLGADSLVTCRLGSESIAARVAGSSGCRRGDSTWLSWAPGAQHLFDGRRRAGAPTSYRQATATQLA